MSKEQKEYSSTYERLMNESEHFKKNFEKGYQEFALSELILALMEDDHISVRALAKEAGVSPSLIQDLRTAKKKNLTLSSFYSIADALGYDVVLERRVKKSTAPRKYKVGTIQKKSPASHRRKPAAKSET